MPPNHHHHHPEPSPSSSSSSRPSLTSSDSTLASSPELSGPLQQLSLSDSAVQFKESLSGDSFDLVQEEEEMQQVRDYRDEIRAVDRIHHGRPAHSRTNSKTFTSRVERPVLPPRQTSFSKRHASFDSPAEVPLPSPLSHPQRTPSARPTTHSRTSSRVLSSAEQGQLPGSPITVDGPLVGGPSAAGESNPFSSHSVYGSGTQRDSYFGFGFVDGTGRSSSESGSSSNSSTTSLPRAPTSPKQPRSPLKASDSNIDGTEVMTDPSHSQPQGIAGKGKDREQSEFFSQPSQHAMHIEDPQPKQSSSAPTSAPITPFSRPYSTPNATESGKIFSPKPVKAWDRSSTASLPLPSQEPFFTLPSVAHMGEVREETDRERDPAKAEDDRSTSPPMFESTSTPSPSPPLSPHRRGNTPPVLLRATSSPSVAAVPAISSSRSSASPDQRSTPLSVASGSTVPPPAPPTILTPPPPPLSPESMNSTSRQPAPYEPFLSHAPPPGDSWIAVETSQREYRLIVRLPGFGRDSITLATRRRRILHIVADSWGTNGGHFERRISFGYDADLAHVRAEFDGEMLKVSVPRRPPSSWITSLGRD